LDELAGALVVDRDSEHVAREEVTCKLHTSQVAPDRASERAGERSLAHAGNVLDEEMPAGEERHERELHGVLFAFERPLDGLSQPLNHGELLG